MLSGTMTNDNDFGVEQEQETDPDMIILIAGSSKEIMSASFHWSRHISRIRNKHLFNFSK